MFENNKKNFIKRILKDKVALLALFSLCVMYFLIAFADFFAVYPSTFANRKLAYCPPSNVYILDKNNHLKKPYTYNYIKTFNKESLTIEYKQDRSKK